MLSEEYLSEIKSRLAKVSRGWAEAGVTYYVEPGFDDSFDVEAFDGIDIYDSNHTLVAIATQLDTMSAETAQANAAIIIHAADDIEALLKENEQLRAQVEKLQEANEAMLDDFYPVSRSR